MSNGSTTTYFVGSHYEVANGVVTKYYYAGAQRIALRTNGTLNYLLGDHLGSTSLPTDAVGNVISEMRYKAWGETRYASGTTPTKYQYTGQYSYVSDFGLHFYNARWYDSSLSRFASADSIVPLANQGSQAWDRYAYTSNNPIRYVDPSGHRNCEEDGYNCPGNDIQYIRQSQIYKKYLELQKRVKNGTIKSDLEALAQLTEYGASLTPSCTSCFVNNMAAVLTGYVGSSPSDAVSNHRDNPDKYPQTAFFEESNFKNTRLSQTGFAPIFKDNYGQGDQSRHYWFYVQTAYFDSLDVSWAGNVYHETIDPSSDAKEKSYQDFVLGLEGSELGFHLATGFVTPQEAGQYIRDNLSKDSFSAWYWSHPLGTVNQYIEWSEQK